MIGRIFFVFMLAVVASFGATQPNIILVLTDDMGVECLGAYAESQHKTPVLDRMAAEGVRFDHAHATPLCTPTRVELMTGRDNVHNYVRFGHLKNGSTTFAHALKESGYETGLLAKWQLAQHGGMPIEKAGFDWICTKWNEKKDRGFWGIDLNLNGQRIELGKDDYMPDHFSRYAEGWIQQERAKPFFLYVPLYLPHDPFQPTLLSDDRDCKDKQANFEAMVSYADHIVGRLWQAVEAAGQADNTVLLFIGDNGTNSKLKVTWKGVTEKGGKRYTRDGGTWVPMIAYGAGVAKGSVCSDLIDLSDFFPTLLELAGADSKDWKSRLQLDGVSFAPQLKGETGTPREWGYTYYNPMHWFACRPTAWTRTVRYKLYDDGRFFDTETDPLEKSPIQPDTDELKKVHAMLKAALATKPAKGESLDPTLKKKKSKKEK